LSLIAELKIDFSDCDFHTLLLTTQCDLELKYKF